MGVCAALDEGDFITSTFRGHGHALAKGLSLRRAALRALRGINRLLSGQGRVDARGQHGQGHGAGHRDRGRRHPACRRNGARAQDAEADRTWSPASSATAPWPREPFTRGSTSRPSGTFRSIFVCENNLYGASTRIDRVMRGGNSGRSGRRVRHQGPDGRRQRRAGGVRGDARRRRRMPRRARTGPPGTAHLPPHRPLPARRLPLPAADPSAKSGCAATRSTGSREFSIDQGLAEQAELDQVRAGGRARVRRRPSRQRRVNPLPAARAT